MIALRLPCRVVFEIVSRACMKLAVHAWRTQMAKASDGNNMKSSPHVSSHACHVHVHVCTHFKLTPQTRDCSMASRLPRFKTHPSNSPQCWLERKRESIDEMRAIHVLRKRWECLQRWSAPGFTWSLQKGLTQASIQNLQSTLGQQLPLDIRASFQVRPLTS
jgi:hypothetical protein